MAFQHGQVDEFTGGTGLNPHPRGQDRRAGIAARQIVADATPDVHRGPVGGAAAQPDEQPALALGPLTPLDDAVAASFARERLLAGLQKHRVRNPLAIGGDIHAALVANTHADPRNLKSPVLLGEICASSLNAEGWPPEHWDEIRGANANVLLADGAHRGYVVMDFDAKACRAKVRGLEDATRRDSGVATVAALVMEDGVPGFKRA